MNFLDVTLDLNKQIHKPYQKPNSPLVYVNNKSNHPPSILKNIPVSVNKRLTELSSSEEVFNETIEPYQEALDKAGYGYKLRFAPKTQGQQKVRRNRKIIWYTPPYSRNVATNIGKEFFQLLDKCFPKPHILNPIFNRNTVKMSCLPSIGSIISSHNRKLISPPSDEAEPCDCEEDQCPVGGNCQKSGVIYQAKITTENQEIHTYVGLTGNKFSERYGVHQSNFRNYKTRNQTKLSTKIWELKR